MPVVVEFIRKDKPPKKSVTGAEFCCSIPACGLSFLLLKAAKEHKQVVHTHRLAEVKGEEKRRFENAKHKAELSEDELSNYDEDDWEDEVHTDPKVDKEAVLGFWACDHCGVAQFRCYQDAAAAVN